MTHPSNDRASTVVASDVGSVRAQHGLAEDVVGGVPVAVTTFAAAVQWLHDWTVRRRGGIDIRLVNAYSVVSIHRDDRYMGLVRESGVSLPDGAPVLAALRLIRGRHEAGRVRGPSLFAASLAHGAAEGVGEFFLGTTDETLSRLAERSSARWPGIRISGAWAPPFIADTDDDFIESCRRRVEQSGADRVWVALGTPKQDYVAQRLAEAVGVPCIAVGAAFDFVAGTKREAPAVFQRLGAEWVFRFLSEPRRLWRRYLLGNFAFVGILAGDLLRPRRSIGR